MNGFIFLISISYLDQMLCYLCQLPLGSCHLLLPSVSSFLCDSIISWLHLKQFVKFSFGETNYDSILSHIFHLLMSGIVKLWFYNG